MEDTAQRASKGAVALLALVGTVFLTQLGVVITGVIAAPSMSDPSRPELLIGPDAVSDRVAATAAEFRVDESGAATYSIPLYGAPGTAGVAPKLSLNYSSQGGSGPLGKGWSIGGLSSVTRCRASREAGDFIQNGQPVDGNPAPVNFGAGDRFCLDGQRLIAYSEAGSACPAAGGMSGTGYRTELESFQRVCAYADATGPKFFTVERKDGSTSWYGDRDNHSSANRPDGYVNSTAPGFESYALAWAQTRFQDSTGNYIDYLYTETAGEHVLDQVRYTGKTVLPGQNGSALAPYAVIDFTYSHALNTRAYVAGGETRLTQRLASITSSVDATYSGQYEQVRHYALGYDFGSASTILTSVQECADSSRAVCAGATTFAWTQQGNVNGFLSTFFQTQEQVGSIPNGSLAKFEGLKFGDIDGDGRQDLLWFKDGQNGEACPTDFLNIGFGRLTAGGQPNFEFSSPTWCSPSELAWDAAPSTWFLFDYTGDGRDDLFVRRNDRWIGFRAIGTVAQPFDFSVDLMAELAQPIPAGTHQDAEPQHADVNGDGLIDLVYPRNGVHVVRIMERGGSYGFRWGAERTLTLTDDACGGVCAPSSYTLYRKDNYQQLNDFNADARSDLLMTVPRGCSGGGDPGPGPGPGDPPIVIQSTTTTSTCTGTAPFTIREVTDTQVIAERYGTGVFDGKMSFADINGDGLTDWIAVGQGGAAFGINSGKGFTSGDTSSDPGLFSIITSELQVADINGDGRADIVHPTGDFIQFAAHYGTASGGFTSAVRLPNTWTGCSDRTCLSERTYLFGDFDADGGGDYMRILWKDGYSPIYYSRPAEADRFRPRDVITRIINGLGAETDITYAALNNGALYRPGVGSRNSLSWGRGSPVQDLLAPMYVVARAASTSPQPGAPNAKASVHYRYHGARVQAGGRGFLGFTSIETIDANHADGFVVTRSDYHQAFPYTGLPVRTAKRLVTGTYTVPVCLSGPVLEQCFSPNGYGLPDLGGSLISENVQSWETQPAFAAGMQAPVHARTVGTSERLRDPYAGVVTSRVDTAFGYGAHGNVKLTSVDTYSGDGVLEGTVMTSSRYDADDPARWRLGRLTANTVTHQRPGQTDVVRSTSFGYAMAGAATGLLTEERVQPGGALAEDQRTVYSLDEFGNRYQVARCSAHSNAGCGPAGFNARPADAMEVNRYARTAYDARGRFPIATVEPFLTWHGVQEVATQTVIARDKFGGVREAINHNGVRSFASPGLLGRPHYAWVQTDPYAQPGRGGRTSVTTYRACGTAGDQAACPTGARVRQRVMSSGAPTQWTYLDALGRTVMTAAQTFNAGVSGRDVSAVCTRYDASGRTVGVSNPFFLPGLGGDLATLSAGVCESAPHWTTTQYDVLGRVRRIVAPDQSVTSTNYSGLTTAVTDARTHTTTQVRNGLGEVVRIIDPAGLALLHTYDAAGRLTHVRRDAGAGQIVNSFGFDALGRKVWQNDPDAGYRTFRYNALGELIEQADPAGNTTRHSIDGRGRIWQTTVARSDGMIETQSTFDFDGSTYGLGQLSRESITGSYGDGASAALVFDRNVSYDSMGRPASSSVQADGRLFWAATQYDALGRPYKVQDASTRWSKTEFDSRGFASAVCESEETDYYWACPQAIQRTRATDAFGNVVEELRTPNANLPVMRQYNEQTGRLSNLCAGSGCSLVDEAYGWDGVGNLHTQRKEGRYLEFFKYDALDRLEESRLLMRDGITVNEPLQTFAYDPLGNVCRMNGVSYAYEGGLGCGAGVTGASAASSAPAVLQSTSPASSGGRSFGSGRAGALPPARPAPMKVAWSYRSEQQAPEYRLSRYGNARPEPSEQMQRPRSGPGWRLTQTQLNRLPVTRARQSAPRTAAASASPTYTPPMVMPRPHLVTQTGSGTGVTYYAYDARGNQTSKDAPGTINDRTVHYSLDDRPYEVSSGNGTRTRYWYGPGGQRYKREEGSKTTYYLGNVEVILEGGVTTFKRIVGGVLQQTITGNTVREDYLFHDRLGSVVKLTDAAGAVQKSLDYAAFGSRRDPATPAGSGTGTPITPRGYTGHEHIDSAGVIHMNARLFDPALGRFLQPDPVIQAPGNTQSWNAYSYVLNNPLRYTDPTGMLGVEERQWVAAAVAIVAAVFGQYYITQGAYTAAFVTAVSGGFVSGAIATQSFRGGLMGAMSAMLTAGLGINAAQVGVSGTFAHGAMLAFTGGVMSALQGGNFGHGFLAAGLTAGSMPAVATIGNTVARTVVGAVVGGTISELTGGKFANGAITGAIMAAMAGRRDSHDHPAQDAFLIADGDGTQGAPEYYREMIRDPRQREEFLNEISRSGWGGVSGKIKYIHGYKPGRPTVGAEASRNGVTFYRKAFEYNYSAILSVLDHEYVHFWQYQLGRWDGVRVRSAEGMSMELEAYDEQMTRSTFANSSPGFQGAIKASRQDYFNRYFSSCALEDCSGFYLSGGR